MDFKRVVAVYIFNSQNKLLFLYHKKTNTWLPTGGHIEDGEFTHEAAIREVYEESGLEIEFIYHDLKLEKEPNQEVEMLPVPLFIQKEKGIGYCHEDFVYIARAKDDKHENKEGHQMGWFSIDEAMALEIFPNVKSHLEYINRILGSGGVSTPSES